MASRVGLKQRLYWCGQKTPVFSTCCEQAHFDDEAPRCHLATVQVIWPQNGAVELCVDSQTLGDEFRYPTLRMLKKRCSIHLLWELFNLLVNHALILSDVKKSFSEITSLMQINAYRPIYNTFLSLRANNKSGFFFAQVKCSVFVYWPLEMASHCHMYCSGHSVPL